MPRRRRRAQRSVSLFPFLSILACVIGTLTLMITALALGQMDNETVASAEKFELAKRLLEQILQEIERFEQELAKAESTADDTQKILADLRERLERLRREKQNLIVENQRPFENVARVRAAYYLAVPFLFDARRAAKPAAKGKKGKGK